jgi:hypothetical protein
MTKFEKDSIIQSKDIRLAISPYAPVEISAALAAKANSGVYSPAVTKKTPGKTLSSNISTKTPGKTTSSTKKSTPTVSTKATGRK